jgi:hypothetical protein
MTDNWFCYPLPSPEGSGVLMADVRISEGILSEMEIGSTHKELKDFD